MDFQTILKQINPETAKVFIDATFDVVNAFLLKAEENETAVPPSNVDYNAPHRGLKNDAPAGGWISDAEVRATLRKQVESMKVANWMDGFLTAIKLLVAIGAV